MSKVIEELDDASIGDVFEIIKRARYMIVCTVDESERLCVVRKGISELSLPDAMRYYAEVLEKMQESERAEQTAAQTAEEYFNATPTHLKAMCPGCGVPVVLVTPLPPPEVMARPNVKARCVCTCGAFLVPFYEAPQVLAMRMMTIEEIAELPDEVRNRMLHLRRRFAGAEARREQRKEH